jgi:hypothetical protein
VQPAFEKSEQSDNSDLPTRHEYKSAGTAEIGVSDGDMPWLTEKDVTSTSLGTVVEMDDGCETDRK